MSARLRAAIALGATLVVSPARSDPPQASPPPALPEPGGADVGQERCLHAFEWSQRFRAMGELKAAREQLRRCIHTSCLPVLRARCAGWLREVESQIPTIRLSVTGLAPEALAGARVTLDGAPIVEALGAPIAVDPKEHQVEVFLRDGRRQALRFRAAERARDLPVVVTFVASGPGSVGAGPYAEPDDSQTEIGLIAVGFGLTGAGALVGSIVGGVSVARGDSLAEQCRTRGCTQREIDAGQNLAHVSTASFVVAGAAAVVGIVGVALFATNASQGSARAFLGPNGLGISGAF